MARFCSIASGSSGNCIYVGIGGVDALVDAGLSGRRVESGLTDGGLNPASLRAIFITHEHSDHTKGAGVLARRYRIPIYATRGTWAAMEQFGALGRVAPQYRKYVRAGEDIPLGAAHVRPFAIPHDAAEPVGYSFFGEGRKITVATDIGQVTPAVREAVHGSDVLLLESNHDVDMLTYGRYPVQLKRRILSDVGHLSNVAAGKLLADLCLMEGRARDIFLGHLSAENNRPALAYETVRGILAANGVDVDGDVRLHLADRDETGRLLTI